MYGRNVAKGQKQGKREQEKVKQGHHAKPNDMPSRKLLHSLAYFPILLLMQVWV